MKKLEDLKVAIVADWLTNRGGAEQVVLEMVDIFPQADIFTSVYRPKLFPELKRRQVYTSFLQTMPLGTKHQLWPLLRPKALEQLNLDDYDLVISSSSAEAKGVITKPETLHICYCHTPTRYYWSHYHYYLRHPEYGALNPIVHYLMPKFIHHLRLWDRVAADRVDKFVANSHHIASRIRKYYEADSQVIYPPVDSARFEVSPKIEDYYLIVGRQTGYKRTDIAIEAFNQLGLPLKIIGTGPALRGWMLKAKSNIQFLGRLGNAEVASYMSKCQALIFPQEEDAGIVPLEAMASGRPVIAYRGGGAMETIIPNVTGIFFDHQSAPALIEAIKKFADLHWKPKIIREHALKFDRKIFQRTLKNFIQKTYNEYQLMQKINDKF